MTGPSSEQLQLQDEQIAFYQQARKESDTAFGQQQELLKQMQDIYDPILAKGPNQRGFSDEQRADLNAQTVEGTASNYARAARAVKGSIATRGGGDNPLASGMEEELGQEVALSSSAEQSREQSQVLQADYASGKENFEGATKALEFASGQLNPTEYINAGTNAGNSAEKTASDIVSEQNSWLAPVMGAVGGLGGGLLSNPNVFK